MADESLILAAIKAQAIEQEGKLKLACADAFNIADELDIELTDVTRVCNKHKIKIARCQLGCFK